MSYEWSSGVNSISNALPGRLPVPLWSIGTKCGAVVGMLTWHLLC